MPEIAIVIVTWNGRGHIETCLPALNEQTFQDFKVILVDNGSTDGTVDFVRTHFPDVEIIALTENGGFAGPNNLGINRALEDPSIKYIVTLNNDTKIHRDFLKELVSCAERHPEAGAIQAKIINYFEQDILDSTGMLTSKDMSAINRGLRETDASQYEQEEEVFGAAASAALYRRDALEKVALIRPDGSKDYFDSDYFAYHEDVDLAWRLRLAGYKAVYTPEAKVLHMHSMTGKSYSPFKAYQVHRNHYFNIIKNLPLPQMVRALALMPRLYLASFLSVVKKKGVASELARSADELKSSPAMIVLRGWLEVLRMLPIMLAKRRQVQAMRVVDSAEIERWFKDYKADFDKIVSG